MRLAARLVPTMLALRMPIMKNTVGISFFFFLLCVIVYHAHLVNSFDVGNVSTTLTVWADTVGCFGS